MSQLGMGVMINMLSGNEDSVDAIKKSLGEKITKLSIDDNSLHFEFENGVKLRMFDNGQSCCERRYMSTDDNLSEFIGATLQDAKIKDATCTEGEYGDPHEIQFLEIITSQGSFVCQNHNEHNGYYGGFSIKCELL